MSYIDGKDCQLVEGKNCEIKIEFSTQMIDVTTRTEPDPDWRFRDKAGHVHRWRQTRHKCESCGGRLKEKMWHVPTCETVTVWPAECVKCRENERRCPRGTTYCEIDECDLQREVKTVCKKCGDEIKPKRRPTRGREFAPGLYEAHGTITVAPETEIASRLHELYKTGEDFDIAEFAEGVKGPVRIMSWGIDGPRVQFGFDAVGKLEPVTTRRRTARKTRKTAKRPTARRKK